MFEVSSHTRFLPPILGIERQWTQRFSDPKPSHRNIFTARRRPKSGCRYRRPDSGHSRNSNRRLLLRDARLAAETASGSALNAFLALDPERLNAFRHRLSELLQATQPDQDKLTRHLHHSASCQLHLPAVIGDYTDFYTRNSSRRKCW